MKTLDPMVFCAVLVEMMGTWLLWSLILTATFGIVAFVWVFLRERGLSSKRLIIAEIPGLFCGDGALVLMAYVTLSGFTDAGSPVDWLLVGLIWGSGLVGATTLSYAVLGLLAHERRQQRFR